MKNKFIKYINKKLPRKWRKIDCHNVQDSYEYKICVANEGLPDMKYSLAVDLGHPESMEKGKKLQPVDVNYITHIYQILHKRLIERKWNIHFKKECTDEIEMDISVVESSFNLLNLKVDEDAEYVRRKWNSTFELWSTVYNKYFKTLGDEKK